MGSNVSAELVSIGTEILLGEITDTNSVFLARGLRDMGINVFYMTSVGDNLGRIADTISLALSRSDIVITCGGLGPTVDDMTRQGVAMATERDLIFEQALLDQIEARFRQFRVKMTSNNRRQAYLPTNAIPIENPVGTAPAFIVEVGSKSVISLPGVPREMKFLMQEKVIPYLRSRYNITEQIILARILKTGGIGESMLDELLGPELLESSNPTVGLAAHSGQIDVRITAKADTRMQAESMIDAVETQVRQRAGRFIFGTDSDRLEDAFIAFLKAHDIKLAISETGISGLFLDRLGTASSDQDLVINPYSFSSPDALYAAFNFNEQLPLLDVCNVLSAQILEETAASVVITLITDPTVNESEDSRASTVIVVRTALDSWQRVYGFGALSESIYQFVGNWGMAMAWRLVKDLIERDR